MASTCYQPIADSYPYKPIFNLDFQFPDRSEDALPQFHRSFCQRISHVLFALFTVMLVLATMELVAHDMHAKRAYAPFQSPWV
jgi:hypothetical protein